MMRGVLLVAGRLALGLVIGVTLGAGYWTAQMLREGHNLSEALQGQVEDALGGLEGLVALGGMCGAGVGLCSGLAVLLLRRPDQTPGD